MERCIFNDVAHAYCENLEEYRQIKIRLIEITTRADSKKYKWTLFNCLEQFNCEHYDRLNGCPFIAEVIKQYSYPQSFGRLILRFSSNAPSRNKYSFLYVDTTSISVQPFANSELTTASSFVILTFPQFQNTYLSLQNFFSR